VAARNVGATGAWRALEERARHDPAPVLRAHALWALEGLDPARARPLLERARTDAEPLVRDEAAALIAPSS
jgi:HEAT repeat protein